MASAKTAAKGFQFPYASGDFAHSALPGAR